MPDKSNFTPDEWKLLLESVMMAGIAVSAAEPSGLWGLLKESFAEGNALMTAKLDPGADALIKAVVADFETAEGRSTARDGLKEKLTGSKPSEITAKCIETLRQAGAVVDAKAPGDAAAFKGWLRQISQHVAEAVAGTRLMFAALRSAVRAVGQRPGQASNPPHRADGNSRWGGCAGCARRCYRRSHRSSFLACDANRSVRRARPHRRRVDAAGADLFRAGLDPASPPIGCAAATANRAARGSARGTETRQLRQSRDGRGADVEAGDWNAA